MNISPSALSCLTQELVHERIRTLHAEAEEERLASRINSVRKAQRRMERASRRLSEALSRV
ncbi:hypothetical protein Pth03_54250 [Planotetraspora thailandica]|uniref:Uncharacterized protein n=1 Tax=Planotetraspora thailandica TaxID=487172 RepID=A0A8J3XYB9_9ACTN|nr:hypothetical protein [Planotetraspora thailandica]GII57036.1 hypothetical protein Pth03_54250 [Planotetraspora thailandica]